MIGLQIQGYFPSYVDPSHILGLDSYQRFRKQQLIFSAI